MPPPPHPGSSKTNALNISQKMIEMFVRTKHKIDKSHEFALVVVNNDATWVSGDGGAWGWDGDGAGWGWHGDGAGWGWGWDGDGLRMEQGGDGDVDGAGWGWGGSVTLTCPLPAFRVHLGPP